MDTKPSRVLCYEYKGVSHRINQRCRQKCFPLFTFIVIYAPCQEIQGIPPEVIHYTFYRTACIVLRNQIKKPNSPASNLDFDITGTKRLPQSLSSFVKRPEREASHSSLSSAEVSDGWSFNASLV
jgi:hypothetical protein